MGGGHDDVMIPTVKPARHTPTVCVCVSGCVPKGFHRRTCEFACEYTCSLMRLMHLMETIKVSWVVEKFAQRGVGRLFC